MKLPTAVVSKSVLAVVTTAACIGISHGQQGNPYDTGMDNPFLKKQGASPSPSASGAAKNAPQTAAKALSQKDNKFLLDAASDFGWEIKTGSMAEKKAQNPKTKQVASRMVSSYSKLGKELTDLAGKKGLSISLESAHAQQINGANFDQSYLNLVQQDHQQAASLFRKASQSADDPDVKAWARKTLATVEQNQSAAK